jgi:hypothetical protein
MALGRGVRGGFVAGVVVAVAVAAGAGLAQPWAGDPGAPRARTGGAAAAEVVETGIPLRSHVAGVAPFGGELVAVTGGGEVVRSRDGRSWRQVPTTGFSPRTTTRRKNGEACAGDTVGGVAAGNGLLVAVGEQAVDSEPGDEYCDARRKVWVSNDAATWRAVEPSGLAATDVLDAVAGDPSGFLAFGSARPPRSDDGDDGDGEEQGRGLQLWRSSDGVSWETVSTDGLSKPSEYKYQSVHSLAARGDHILAALAVECLDCFDDDVLALWRSEGVAAWQEVEVSGLDALDQANSDIIPAVAATQDGYLAFGSVGKDHADDRTPAMWRSGDGRQWDETILPGPPSDGEIDAATTWSGGVIALDSTRGGLVVWRVETR